ncbi:RsmD family RNA methyltransferase [Brachybacterium sp. EF45031]|uniref:RsmD family RNA methyltransferase n=1 Tax=Brachybacterium sillae TaxID=2810536 RepID=UPI00217EBFF6|nr:RsmD family RNA methyltransferase [Brachybacterium sillae]MCS6710844.1 RsmD family RNA methyltransferase [Brachybacterium sillae]
MPRIIAGRLGGRPIPGSVGPGTRPTSDRVREAVFSRLDGWDALDGARVADLYAGTGALALEALSRGAAHALVVEAHGPTASTLRRATRALGLADVTEVRHGRAEQSVDALAPGSLDLVFLDPPYDVATVQIEDLLQRLLPALTPDAVVVVERSARGQELQWPQGYADDGAKRYGETVVHYGGPTVAA